MSNNNANQLGAGVHQIKERRTRLGMTRMELARHARCSITAVANIEGGVTQRGRIIKAIERILTEMEEA